VGSHDGHLIAARESWSGQIHTSGKPFGVLFRSTPSLPVSSNHQPEVIKMDHDEREKED
jgi:hypothetical protein